MAITLEKPDQRVVNHPAPSYSTCSSHLVTSAQNFLPIHHYVASISLDR